jgi:hypothetical protein
MAGRRHEKDATPPPRVTVPSTVRAAASRPPAEGPAAARQPAVRELRGPMFIDTASGTFVDRRPAAPVLSRRDFQAELDRLARAYARQEENPRSISCRGCARCVSCMFCTDCEECARCTHCTRCRSSSNLTHCVDCTGLHDCAYCVQSEGCAHSNYLVLCRSCSECTYCFGCVGLDKADFHVLNVKYTRSEYFRIVKALEEELGIARE